MTREHVRLSKFLSLVLRHRPEHIGLTIDAGGWADVNELVRRAREHDVPLTLDKLQRVVTKNDKQRFALRADGTRIRARQGHSIDVDLGLEPVEPPPLLYHGTARHNLTSIRSQGLHRAGRQHVHLSRDTSTAHAVGGRHGRPVALTVEARSMHANGHTFHLSENGVWLTKAVPPAYIRPTG